MKVTMVKLATAMGFAALATANPVSKVVQVLQVTQTQLKKEGKEDDKAYEKMQCWCNSNKASKASAIADEKASLAQANNTAQGGAAAMVQFQTELSQLQADLNSSQVSLASAQAIRSKAAGDWKLQEVNLVHYVKMITQAIDALKSVTPGNVTALLATSANPLLKVTQELSKFDSAGALTPSQKKLLLSLGQRNLRSMQPQTIASVVAALTQLKDNFTKQLEDGRKQEAADAKSFEDLKASKATDLAAVQSNIQQKQIALAQAQVTAADATQNVKDTQAARAADAAFLKDVEAECALWDKQYKERTTARAQEVAAVAQAISILTSDAALDTLSKTFKPASLLEIRLLTPVSRALHEAAAILESDFLGSSDVRLSAVRSAAKLGPSGFGQVLTAIDSLIQQLASEDTSEKAQLASCNKRAADNANLTQQFALGKADGKSRLTMAKIAVESINVEVKGIQSEVDTLNTQLTKLVAARQVQQTNFNNTIADQQQLESLLQQALGVLKQVYTSGVAAPVDTKVAAAGKTEKPAFSTYGASRAQGANVIALLEGILRDAQKIEKQAAAEEAQAKAEFDKFVKETNTALQAKQQSIVDKNQAKAEAQQRYLAAQQDMASSEAQLSNLAVTVQAVDVECAVFKKTFDARAAARANEISVLTQAKTILAPPAVAGAPAAAM